MDAQDGRVVTSRARKDVEEAYDEEQLGGSKGVFLVIQMEGWFLFLTFGPPERKTWNPNMKAWKMIFCFKFIDLFCWEVCRSDLELV